MTQTVPDISPLMPMHQDPLLVVLQWCCDVLLLHTVKYYISTWNGVTGNKLQTTVWRLFLVSVCSTACSEYYQKRYQTPYYWPIVMGFHYLWWNPSKRANKTENIGMSRRHHYCSFHVQPWRIMAVDVLLRHNRHTMPTDQWRPRTTFTLWRVHSRDTATTIYPDLHDG